MARTIPMRNGIFLAPFHPLDQDPTEALHRDLELIENLDRLGYEEAWIGEHHSAGFEIIASPEVFIAAAAERTKNIRLGTGVVSLPYHNPLMTANRIIQLDHQTRGRVMLGVGPGLLPSDAMMLGINPMTQRDRMLEGIEVIMRLFNGEVVTEKSEWYNLVNARAHLLPYTKPHPEIAVASAVSPSGGRAAGKYGFGMLCVAATNANGFDALSTNWAVANEIAAENGRTMDRSKPAPRRSGAHRRDSRAGAQERQVRHPSSGWSISRGSTRSTPPPRRRGSDRWNDRIGQRRHRHAGRRDRADQTPRSQAGRVRRLSAARAQLGEPSTRPSSRTSYGPSTSLRSSRMSNVSRQASYDWTMSNAHGLHGPGDERGRRDDPEARGRARGEESSKGRKRRDNPGVEVTQSNNEGGRGIIGCRALYFF